MTGAELEVLRYLGHKGQDVDDALMGQVQKAMEECRRAARPAGVYRIFPSNVRVNAVLLEGTGLRLTGRSIVAHLEKALQTAAMAATLGIGVETLIRRWEYTDMTYAVILDAAATQLIEEVCDGVEAEIKEKAREEGLETNFRFSPGYGDFSLEIQPMLLQALNASRAIGLTCTDTLILTPRKSVTAFLGLLPQGSFPQQTRSCALCSLRDNCLYRKDGGHCGTDREN